MVSFGFELITDRNRSRQAKLGANVESRPNGHELPQAFVRGDFALSANGSAVLDRVDSSAIAIGFEGGFEPKCEIERQPQMTAG
jgi:hypothetical protein